MYWVCEEDYNALCKITNRKGMEVHTHPNMFDSKCVLCDKIAKYPIADLLVKKCIALILQWEKERMEGTPRRIGEPPPTGIMHYTEEK